jgi:antitoxin (DNA-binding transcriptional repressor) of toxin-antitoxin stability system
MLYQGLRARGTPVFALVALDEQHQRRRAGG